MKETTDLIKNTMQNKELKCKKNLKGKRGITLIALVITIIVLLILVSVSIATLIGENGILTRARRAKMEVEIAELKERTQIDILEKQSYNEGKITEQQLIEILKKYFSNTPSSLPEDISTVILTAKEEYGGYTDIHLSDIYNGEIEREEAIKPYGKGDVNYDGKIDGLDQELILNHINNRVELTGEEFKRADINNDGMVDISDLTIIIAYIGRQ